MIKILILYYSGVRNTRMVAEKFYSALNSEYDVDIFSIETIDKNLNLDKYDALIVGFPTIHSSPAKPIMDFLEALNILSNLVPTFVFTTCGLYATNTLRIFSKKCVKKNIIPVMNKSYRCAATDGILIAPFMKIWFKHEKNLKLKIKSDAIQFASLIIKGVAPSIPSLKWYSILNYPNKFFGQRFSPKIYLNENKCIKCRKCIENCPVKCYKKDIEGFPAFQKQKCIHCYRCIHHCPVPALSLSSRHTPTKTLLKY